MKPKNEGGWWGRQSTDNRNALLIAAAVLLAVFIFCFCTRYEMMSTGKGFAYMYDRITGQTWYYMADEYFPCKPGK